MKRWVAVTATATLLLVTGCSQAHEDARGRGDAPVATTSAGRRGGDDSPAQCTNMPDGYSNVCTKCVSGAKPWRFIVTTHTDTAPSAMSLVQDPAACGGHYVPGPVVVPATPGNGAVPPDDGS